MGSRLTTCKSVAIPNDVMHIIIFSSLQSLTMIVLYNNVLFVLVGSSRKNVVLLCSLIDVKNS
jgi:hypothetical protein